VFNQPVRSTQPSTLRGTVKWVSAFRLSNNKWRWWVCRRTHSLSRLAWSWVGGGLAPFYIFIKWTGWILAMALPWRWHHKHCLGIIIIVVVNRPSRLWVAFGNKYAWNPRQPYFIWYFRVFSSDGSPYFVAAAFSTPAFFTPAFSAPPFESQLTKGEELYGPLRIKNRKTTKSHGRIKHASESEASGCEPFSLYIKP